MLINFIISALKIIFLLGFLILIHEAGHLIVAKLCKVKVNEFLKKYDDELFLPQCRYDMEIEVSDVTYDFVQSLDLLEPTGNGNVKPLFKITLNEAKISPCKNNQSHISVMLDSGFQLFAFNYSKLGTSCSRIHFNFIITWYNNFFIN